MVGVLLQFDCRIITIVVLLFFSLPYWISSFFKWIVRVSFHSPFSSGLFSYESTTILSNLTNHLPLRPFQDSRHQLLIFPVVKTIKTFTDGNVQPNHSYCFIMQSEVTETAKQSSPIYIFVKYRQRAPSKPII